MEITPKRRALIACLAPIVAIIAVSLFAALVRIRPALTDEQKQMAVHRAATFTALRRIRAEVRANKGMARVKLADLDMIETEMQSPPACR